MAYFLCLAIFCVKNLVVDDEFSYDFRSMNIKGDNNITNNSNFTQNQNINKSNNVVFDGNGCAICVDTTLYF